MTSQCAAILAHLRSGRTITPTEAYSLCGTLSCHSRIAELRGRGHDIRCDLIPVPSGKHVGCYRLVGQTELEFA